VETSEFLTSCISVYLEKSLKVWARGERVTLNSYQHLNGAGELAGLSQRQKVLERWAMSQWVLRWALNVTPMLTPLHAVI
jgi:hypothetical protein